MEKFKEFDNITEVIENVKTLDDISEMYISFIMNNPTNKHIGILKHLIEEIKDDRRKMFDLKKERYEWFKNNLLSWYRVCIFDKRDKTVMEKFYFYPYEINDVNHVVFGLYSQIMCGYSEILYQGGVSEKSFDTYNDFVNRVTFEKVDEDEVFKHVEYSCRRLIERRYNKIENKKKFNMK